MHVGKQRTVRHWSRFDCSGLLPLCRFFLTVNCVRFLTAEATRAAYYSSEQRLFRCFLKVQRFFRKELRKRDRRDICQLGGAMGLSQAKRQKLWGELETVRKQGRNLFTCFDF